jgi:uncharacterized protein (TIGR03435 family)
MFGRLLILACGIFGLLRGQPAVAPRFEVASIRPSGDATRDTSGSKSGHGRLTMNNVTLKRCIMGAYGIGPNQIVGGPEWLDSLRYSIEAKADTAAGDTELMGMLRTLLVDRFKLALHRETRPLQVFVLEVAKNGPKLEVSKDAESRTNNQRGSIEARKTTMNRFAEILSRQMDIPVVDRTGLEGVFNLKLEWDPESGKPSRADAASENRPSIFTAIQEQLGLRLRAQKAPVEVLVIDHAEAPTEN